MSTIILSINPEFVQKIFSGEKKFEFRTLLPKKSIKKVIIYATYPISKVVGEFDVAKVLEMEPQKLWDLTCDKSGMEKQYFDNYFMSREFAYAFEIKSFIIYEREKDISCFGFNRPPQSFCYLK